MVEELVDIVDDDDNVIATVTRSEMRAGRLQHRSVGIAVMSTDGRLLSASSRSLYLFVPSNPARQEMTETP